MLIALDGGRCVKSNPPAGWAGCLLNLPEGALAVGLVGH
jgi:hypothetical protein